MFSNKTKNISGCTLSWTELGSGQPILFVHGTAACIWGELFEKAGEIGRAIKYDRRSFGESKSDTYPESLTQHADDAAVLLKELDANPAIIVGWSIGGVIAVELAVKYPDLISGLVLLEPPMWAKANAGLDLLYGVGLSVLTGYIFGPSSGGTRFLNWVFIEKSGESSLEKIDKSIIKEIEANAIAVGIEIRYGTGETITPDMSSTVQVPTVVFAGDRSRQFFIDSSKRIADAIPGAQFQILKNTSHFLQLEQSDTIIEAIKGMIKSKM